jgi:hypothetical protein
MTRSNSKRTINVIVADFHAADRANLFAQGDLLIEAREVAEHGNWATLLREEFNISADTAERLMAVAELPASLRKLPLARSTFYTLTSLYTEGDETWDAIVEALEKATKGKKKLSIADAENEIELAGLRIRFGDYPDATLLALESAGGEGSELFEAFKKKKPTTKEAVAKIEDDIYRAGVIKLYEPYGKFPSNRKSKDLLLFLEQDVPENRRKEVMQKLLSNDSDEKIIDFINECARDDAAAELNARAGAGANGGSNGTDPEAANAKREAERLAKMGGNGAGGNADPEDGYDNLVTAWLKATENGRQRFRHFIEQPEADAASAAAEKWIES